jgi:hypothetical protein
MGEKEGTGDGEEGMGEPAAGNPGRCWWKLIAGLLSPGFREGHTGSPGNTVDSELTINRCRFMKSSMPNIKKHL